MALTFTKKAPRKFICFLWVLAGLRLLMPFEIQSSLSLQPVPEVLNYRRPSFWVSLLAVMAVLFVAVCLLTNPTKVEPSDAVADTIPAQTETQSESERTAKRISDGLETLVSADNYHLFLHDDTNEGGVGWQIHFVKDGENTLWWSTDHRTQEGHMVLNRQNYTYVEKDRLDAPCPKISLLLQV